MTTTNGEPRLPYELSYSEAKAAWKAVKSSLELRKGYVAIPYDEDARMKRKKIRMRKEIPILESALKQLE